MVSIIIPVFNAEPYIEKCISSITQQTCKDIEIVIVNDGSTDNSLEILKDFAAKDERIKLLAKENGGIGSAYNLALEHITGDYVLFVDSDDYLELDACEQLVKYAIINRTDLVGFRRRVVDEEGIEQKQHSHNHYSGLAKNNSEILELFMKKLKHPSLINLYKADLFENVILFDQNIGIDEMLTPQLLLKVNRALFVEDVYYNIVFTENSVSRSRGTPKTNSQIIRVYDFILEYLVNRHERLYHYYAKKFFGILVAKMTGACKDFESDKHYLKVLIDSGNYYYKLLGNKNFKDEIDARSILRFKLIYLCLNLSLRFK